MSTVAKVGSPSVASLLVPANDKITGLHCGEDIKAGDACRVHTDRLIYRSTGAADDGTNAIDGYAATDAFVGQNDPLTLVDNAVWGYCGSTVTPGKVYLSGTVAGGLDTAPSTGGKAPCGKILGDGRIKLWSTRY
jgi:hypothetical protein